MVSYMVIRPDFCQMCLGKQTFEGPRKDWGFLKFELNTELVYRRQA